MNDLNVRFLLCLSLYHGRESCHTQLWMLNINALIYVCTIQYTHCVPCYLLTVSIIIVPYFLYCTCRVVINAIYQQVIHLLREIIYELMRNKVKMTGIIATKSVATIIGLNENAHFLPNLNTLPRVVTYKKKNAKSLCMQLEAIFLYGCKNFHGLVRGTISQRKLSCNAKTYHRWVWHTHILWRKLTGGSKIVKFVKIFRYTVAI